MDDSKNKHEVKPLPHNYDGIEELDNPLPRWWLLTFYITIVFAVFYYGYYEIYDGPSSDEYLSRSLENIQDKKSVAKKGETKLLKKYEELIKDEKMMTLAQGHFATKCAACHGQKGEGLIGPNLTDKFWIYSKGKMDGILKAIKEGFPEKGMPAWDALVPAEEQPYLAAYVIRLQGTKPPNPKAPQGQPVEE